MEKDPTRSVFWYPELFLVFPIIVMASISHTGSLVLALLPPLALYRPDFD